MDSNGFNRCSERSSSRFSIYNYPEHLNPFTEEDNHKRLRFWNFSKSSDNSKKRSFSIGNLRDVWTFRSFNLKKKSSTLGIQKTSESPPVLRRSLNPNGNNGRPLMRSLQNVNTPLGMPLCRESCSPSYHRKPYFDRCSTPQPSRYQTIRSSYSSLSSTNPFESEIESDANNIESPTGGPRTKNYRKKRRAPGIPTKIMITEPSESVQEKSTEAGHNITAEDLDIKSLTSEIERFVSHSNESSDNRSPKLESSLDSKTQQSNTLDTSLLIVESTIPNKSTEEQEVNPREDTASPPRAEHSTGAASLSIVENGNEKIASQENISSKKTEQSNEMPALSKEHLKVEVNLLNIEKPCTKNTTEKQILIQSENNSIKITPPNRKHRLVQQSFLGNEIKNNVSDQDTRNNNFKEMPATKEEHLAIEVNLLSEKNNKRDKPIQEHTVTARQDHSRSNAAASAVSDKQVNSIITTENETFVTNKISLPCKIEESAPVELRTVNNNLNISSEGRVSEPNVIKILSPTNDQVEREFQFGRATNSSFFEARRSYQKNCNQLQSRRYDNNNSGDASEKLDNPLTISEGSDSNLDPTQDKAKATKAKSVKEIIDSINRSQKLLKDSAAKGTNTYSTALYSTNDTTPIVDHTKHKREGSQNDISSGSSSQLQQKDFKKNKIDKIVFQCRESSPTASNLDWNPVPKPKRINSELTNKDINEL